MFVPFSRVAASSVVFVLTATAGAADRVDFNRDIRPILADHCLACHGPDEAHRKAGLRFDIRDGLFGESRGGGDVVSPNRPEHSALIERVATSDDRLRMPPTKFNKPLTPEQIALLERWVAEGADWSQHWAFVPPERPVVPGVTDPGWSNDPVDRFIHARLQREGLTPSPEAERPTLARRLSLDLTGLPPSPEDADRFAADESPDAVERFADRLLASARHGEHMARYWLDAVRYGDTHGLHLDNYREMWPYRDWVIGAFNSGKPFDVFLTEQIAGDLLPEPDLDQLIATGYLRAHVTTSEGGSIAEEVHVRNVVERVDGNGVVLMGLSVGCARCHDHKYDPLTQREYYQLFAYFNNLDGNPLDGNKKDHAPVARVPDDQHRARERELRAEIAEVEKAIATAADARPKYDAPAGPLQARFVRVELEGKGVYLSLAEVQAFAGGENVAVKGKASQQSTEYGGPPEKAIDGNTDGNFGAGSTTHTAQADEPWWEVDLGADQRLDKLVIWNRTDAVSERLQPFRVVLLEKDRQPLWLGRVEKAPSPKVELTVPPTGEQFTDEQRAALADYAATGGVPTPEQRRLEALKASLGELEKSIPTTLIYRERKEAKPAFLLERGEYDRPQDPVERKTPAFLPPLAEGLPNDRLGLARWLTEPGHPLTARVAVNRFWQQVYGVGLTKTADDFGLQGEPPSHPELLDWLAVEYAADGWDTKRLMRRLVTSATYRQSAKVRPDLLARDPSNRLLARGPRFRLDAEVLRDQALFVSGSMVERLGGPSVKPPQPAGLWEAVGYSGSNTVRFVPDTDPEKIHRRGLYTFWKRTAPPPQMAAFDAPTREATCVRRERTNTPMQALLLMNDPQFVEAAKALARRVVRETSPDVEGRVEGMFRLATARKPDPVELSELANTFFELRAGYRDDLVAAKALAGEAEDAPELAAWTVIANVILNLDEVINK